MSYVTHNLCGCGVLGFTANLNVVISYLMLAFALVTMIVTAWLAVKRPRPLFLIVPIFALIWLIAVGKLSTINSGVGAKTYDVYGLLAEYIDMSGGKFPADEAALVSAGLLRKRESSNGTAYFNRVDREGDQWAELQIFEQFTIYYGIDIQQIEEADGGLTMKDTGSSVLLIDGPYHSYLQSTYESLSLHLYRRMLDVRSQRQPSNPDQDE